MARKGSRSWAWGLSRPRFADREVERVAATIELAVLISAAAVVVVLLALPGHPDARYGVEAPLLGLVGVGGAFVLNRLGRHRAASCVFLTLFLGAVVSTFLHVGTLFGPAFGAFLLVIILAGLLLGVRGAAVATVLTMAIAVGLDRLLASELWQQAGWSYPHGTSMPPALLLLAIGGLLIIIPIDRMQRAFAEAKRSEEALEAQNRALRESESRYRLLLESAPLGVIVLDPELRIESLNAELLRMVGAPSSHALQGKDFSERPMYQVPEIRRAVEAAREGGERVTIQASAQSAWGRQVDMRIHVAPLLDDAGELVSGVGFVEDITEQRKLETQLRHAQKLEAVGTLAGGIAHDFNNYLTVILQGAEMLALDLGADDPARGAVDEILRASEQSATLVRQLLAFARKQTFHPRILDPAEVVRSLEQMLQRVLGELVTLEAEVASDLGCVFADPNQLEVALLNLANNARDAMPGGGVLRIEAGERRLDADEAGRHRLEPGVYVALTVSDTGTGMDARTREHIFEPFFTSKPHGTGLGLSSVHGIVAQSGGAIQVETEPGRGSRFRILLPRAGEAGEAFSPGPGLQPKGGSETILLVEDGAAIRAATSRVLRAKGYRVIEAVHGAHALEVAARHGEEIDLVLTDIIMPGIGGVELAHRLGPLCPHVRILFMSGYGDEAVRQQGAPDPAAAILRKPFHLAELLAHVRAVLDSPGYGLAPGPPVRLPDVGADGAGSATHRNPS